MRKSRATVCIAAEIKDGINELQQFATPRDYAADCAVFVS
jgi:hypothetical protein